MNGVLLVIDGVGKGRKFILPEGRKTSIGRSPENEIQVSGEEISRSHSEILGAEGQFRLIDHSSNGTFVNDQRVQEHLLQEGDIIRVGQTQFQFTRPRSLSPDDSAFKFALYLSPDSHTRVIERSALERTVLLDSSTTLTDLQSYQQIHRNLATIYKVGNLISSIEDPDELLQTLLDTLTEVLRFERAVILIRNRDTGNVEPVASRVLSPATAQTNELVLSQTIVDDCVNKGRHILCPDAMMDERFKSGDSVVRHRIRSVMCVPLESQKQILGAIYVDSSQEMGAFVERDLELLAAIGQQAGISIERANLIRELEELAVWSILTLVAAIEAKDEYTRGHSERVAAFSVQVAEELGVGDRLLESVRLGALLHDVGKIGVPEATLKKPTQLTDEEFESIKEHPVRGAYIIGQIQNPRMRIPVEVARHHHERWDGAGYPDGLRGEDIPLSARIVSVADAFDAMSSTRPYRKPRTKEFVAQEFLSKMGIQFDPDVCKAFLRLWQGGRLRRPKTLQWDMSTIPGTVSAPQAP